jgi:hypothetical protein
MSVLHLKGLEQALLGNIAMESDTIKMAFMAVAYTPNAGTDSFYSDVSASVAAGSTDQTLANVDIRMDIGNARVEFDADDVSLSIQTFTSDKILVYKDTGTPSTSPVITTIDLSATIAPVNGAVTITFNAEGIFAINDN